MRQEPLPELTVEDWTLLQARLMWCYEGRVKAEHLRMRSARRQLSAWYVLAGTARIKRGRTSWQANVDEWLFAGPEPFEQTFSPTARILSINFKLSWPAGDSLVTEPVVVSGERHVALLATGRALSSFVTRRFPHAHVALWGQKCGLDLYFELQARFSRWISAYLRAMHQEGTASLRLRGVDPRVAEELRMLDRHSWADRLDHDAVAARLGVSKGQAERLFVRELGMTPIAYLRRRRLEAALAALTDATRPVKQIAYSLGFASPAHFSNWIKKATGRSPRLHRRP